jgi:hypothetical protein
MIRLVLALLTLVRCFDAVPALGAPGDLFEFGIIPPDSPNGPIAACEHRVARAAGRFASALVKCEMRRAKGTYADDVIMDTDCKQPALAKFLQTNLSGCTPCVDLSYIGSEVQSSVIDGGSGLADIIYCAASTAPCTTPNTSCTCTSGPFSGSAMCYADVDGVNIYCVATGGCSAAYCSQDSDCPLQAGEPTVCVRPDYVPPDWSCCYARCDY